MTITQALSLDVARESVVRISAKQFDSNSRYLLITVLESGQEQAIPSASTITLNGRRPDGSSQSFLGEVQDGKAYLKIDDYLLEQYGTVYCSVSIIGSDGAKLSTLSFRMVVERAESTGWVLMYTAPSALSAGTYHINVGSISYQFTLTQALPVGGCIYFASDYTGAKTVVNGADVETLTLTVGTGGTELIGSDVVNFLSQISQEVAEINEGLESKADKSAIEENLAAGTSLATIDKDSYTPNTSPYLHRISPSGKRCEYDVIGGTVGWNQNIAINKIRETRTVQGVQFTNNGNGSVTINGTGTGTTYDAGMWVSTAYDTTHVYFCRSRTESLAQGTSGVTDHGQFAIESERTYNVTIYPCRIDLTTLLGSTIADYAYTLEQATAGSGIAWLKSFGFLSKDYYEYCEPTLESVQATERKAVGINQWDEVWRRASLDTSNGTWSAIGTYSQIASTNYIPVLPNTAYYENKAMFVAKYDAEKNYIGYVALTSAQTFTTDANCHYIMFQMYNYGTTYLNDVCINLSNPTINGQYFPYESHTYPLGDVTLRGIPKLDSNNNIYYDGDVYKASGEITRKYGVVDLGSLSWTAVSSDTTGYNRFVSVEIVGVNTPTGAKGNVMCAKYIAITGNNAYLRTTGVTLTSNGNVVIYDEDLAQGTASAFKTAMSGVYLVYELATPTTESTDSFTPIQYTGSTEEFSTDNEVPVGVDAKYYTDLTLPTLPTANGTYTLKCTVTDGTGIVSWVSE